jgi:hypothetical protein
MGDENKTGQENQGEGQDSNTQKVEANADQQDKAGQDEKVDGGKKPEEPNAPKGDTTAEDKSKVDEEPPVRKTKQDYILERKERQLAKAKAKSEEAQKSQDKKEEEKPNSNQDGEGDQDEDLTPEESAKFEKFVAKRYGKHFEKVEEFAKKDYEGSVDSEVDDFISKDPNGKHFEPYKDKIKNWAKHPTRKNLPISTIAYEIAGPELLKLGAKMAAEADAEAAEGDSPGSSSRKSTEGGKKSFWDMTPEEFAAEQQKVMSKAR